jgi:hypothetical protein
VVIRIPCKRKGLFVSLTRGEIIPEAYQQFSPFFSDYNRTFEAFVGINAHENFRIPYIFHPHTPNSEINYFVTEFFDMYPEMKISMFYLGGIDGIQMENRGIYKLLMRLHNHFKKLKKNGYDQVKALEMTFKKFDDYVNVKMQEVATTQVIAKSLRIRPLLKYLEKDTLDITRNKLAQVQRDIEVNELKDKINNIEEIDSNVKIPKPF